MVDPLLNETMKLMTVVAGIGLLAWLATSWMRFRDAAGRAATEQADRAELIELRHDNERLNINMRSLEQRVEVLELMITNPAHRAGREVTALA